MDDCEGSESSTDERLPISPETWAAVGRALSAETARLHWDLRHLIYPLNYSSQTVHLVPRQERFFDLYEADAGSFQLCEQLPRPDASCLRDNDVSLDELAPEEKVQILMTLLVRTIASRGYEGRARSLLLELAAQMKASADTFVRDVEAVLLREVQRSPNPMRTGFERDGGVEGLPVAGFAWSRRKWAYAAIGVVFGAATCGLTGGFAAPLFLPSLLSAVGMGGIAALSGGAGIAVMATVFGLAGAGMAGYRVSRRFADLKDFRFIPLRDADRNRALRVTICVSGWTRTEDDFVSPWIEGHLNCEEPRRALQAEVYCLAFEKKMMRELGTGIQDFLKSSAVAIAASEMLKYTLTAAASTALLLPVAVLQAGDILDNPWTRGLDRARKAGKALAEALKRGAQGRRPVTLVGYSLGALVVFTCLQELVRTVLFEDEGIPRDALTRAPSCEQLNSETSDGTSSVHCFASGARRTVISTPNSPILEEFSEVACSSQSEPGGFGDGNPSGAFTRQGTHVHGLSLFGIVENVVLLGLPTHLPAPSVWTQLRSLVSGRFVHCYSTRDWVLKFLYRSASPAAREIAGLGPIADIPGIENYDVSHIVDGHLEYQRRLSEILQYVDI